MTRVRKNESSLAVLIVSRSPTGMLGCKLARSGVSFHLTEAFHGPSVRLALQRYPVRTRLPSDTRRHSDIGGPPIIRNLDYSRTED
jgi:hypothetical protein